MPKRTKADLEREIADLRERIAKQDAVIAHLLTHQALQVVPMPYPVPTPEPVRVAPVPGTAPWIPNYPVVPFLPNYPQIMCGDPSGVAPLTIGENVAPLTFDSLMVAGSTGSTH